MNPLYPNYLLGFLSVNFYKNSYYLLYYTFIITIIIYLNLHISKFIRLSMTLLHLHLIFPCWDLSSKFIIIWFRRYLECCLHRMCGWPTLWILVFTMFSDLFVWLENFRTGLAVILSQWLTHSTWQSLNYVSKILILF